MATSEQIEVELKFDVDAGHAAPDLRALPGVVSATDPETFALDATYFDTEALDLAGNAITMRRRTGGPDAGWHLKRPTTVRGARRETRLTFDDAPADGDIPADLQAAAEEARQFMVETAAEASEELMEKYLGGEELAEAEIINALRTRTLATEIVPMYCGSAFKNKGV